MKVRINRFCFFVPLSQKIVSLCLKQYLRENAHITEPIISSLKDFRKEYGHFNIVEIEEKDGNKVVITI